jgi:cytochrome c peroxidase
MGFDFENLVKRLQQNQTYTKMFTDLYRDGITKKNITDAIAEYEKTLITPNAPFDRYLKGDKNAISEKAKKGYRLFKSKGCVICHNGVNIGGNLYNRFGIYQDANSSSLGRYNITQREEDKYVFKVPSLRNVARTAPYMHDGRFETLRSAVKFMTRYQLGRCIEEEDIDAIVAFLESLNGELPLDVKKQP